jgi:DNA modification methylase
VGATTGDCSLREKHVATRTEPSRVWANSTPHSTKASLSRLQYETITFNYNMNITINPEFEKLIPPLSEEEFKQLESNILKEGIRDALVIWNNVLIDGHNRYRIANENGLEFSVVETSFDSNSEAEEWIILNQFGRRNLPAYVRGVLALKLKSIYSDRAKSNQGARTDILPILAESIKPINTREEISKKADVSHGTMSKIEKIEELATPEQKKKLINQEESINSIYKEITNSGKADQIEKRKEEYLIAQQTDVTEENRPTIANASYEQYLDTISNSSIDLLFTDPPYSTDVEDIYSFAKQWLPQALKKIKPNGRAFICIGAYPKELNAYLSVLLEQDSFIVDNPLIWTYKNTLGVTPKMKYNLNYQIILHLYSEHSEPLDTSVTNEMFSVQEINAPDGRLGDRLHQWQKPDELALRLIKHATKEGDSVLDCFACTGTFLVMAARLGRKASGCDISSENLEIAKQRGCLVS